MAIKYFGGKKMKFIFFGEFFLISKILEILGTTKYGKRKRKTWCRVFEFKFEYECSKLDFKEAFSGSKCQKGQLYTDFSACLF
jgi:hypothetical protein